MVMQSCQDRFFDIGASEPDMRCAEVFLDLAQVGWLLFTLTVTLIPGADTECMLHT
jgi:hypothetical protein